MQVLLDFVVADESTECFKYGFGKLRIVNIALGQEASVRAQALNAELTEGAGIVALGCEGE